MRSLSLESAIPQESLNEREFAHCTCPVTVIDNIEYAGVPTESLAIITVSLSSQKQTHDLERWSRSRKSSNCRKNSDAAEASAHFAKHGNKKERRLKVWKPVPAFPTAFAASSSGSFSAVSCVPKVQGRHPAATTPIPQDRDGDGNY
jgi:UDP:flavonoid glycosyltransferase YjiC (YdhE family)